MRSYKAARRAALKEPVEFDYEYVTTEPVVDEDGAPVAAPDGVPVTREVEKSEHFVCKGEVSALTLSEFAYNADVDSATLEGAALVRQFFGEAFGDEKEYQRFFRLHIRHGDDDLLMDILSGLAEDFTGRPTKRPSDSPATPSETMVSGQSLKVVSLSRGTVVQGEVVDQEVSSA
ncbi:MAG: hypothetical protein ACR2JO_08090 [Mycobacteriales bacterium]